MTPFAAPSLPVEGLAIADFNRDGMGDLAAIDTRTPGAPRAIAVLLGAGNGGFYAETSTPVGDQLSALVAVDLDGDGAADVAATDPARSVVHVAIGRGDGTLRPAAAHPVGAGPSAVAVADLAGDTAPDLAVARSDGVDVLPGNGDGTFAAAAGYSLGSGTFGPVRSGDLDGDGRSDVVVVGPDARLTALTSRAGAQPATALALPGVTSVAATTSGDLDGDGVLDLVLLVDQPAAGGRTVRALAVLLGRGGGTFGAPAYRPATGALTMTLVDVDGDGRLDVLLAVGTRVDILLGLGDGRFQPTTSYRAGNGVVALAVADLDLDGRLDLVVANAGDNALSVLHGTAGSFGSPQRFALGASPQAVVAGDLSSDCRPDVVVSGPALGAVVLLADGHGGLGAPAPLEPPGDVTVLGLAHFGTASVLDVVLRAAGAVTVRFGVGNGEFMGSWVPLPGGMAVGVAVGDFDGDGREDLATTGLPPPALRIWTDQRKPPLTAALPAGVGVALADLDGDGLLDVLAPSGGSATLLFNASR